MKQTLLLFLLAITVKYTSAQNPDCKVLLDSLKGTYEGDCSNGKASGKGKAVGMATYEGDFKNGLPDGKGKYTWANGDFYYGGWKKGLKEGKGEIHHTMNGNENLITGYWKKDNYKGEFEEPYKIFDMSPGVSYKNFQKLDSKKKSVYISMKSGVMGGTAIVDVFQVVAGSFTRTNFSEMSTTKIVEFQDVIFPFRVKFTGIALGQIDIEFYESGEWKVEIVL